MVEDMMRKEDFGRTSPASRWLDHARNGERSVGPCGDWFGHEGVSRSVRGRACPLAFGSWSLEYPPMALDRMKEL